MRLCRPNLVSWSVSHFKTNFRRFCTSSAIPQHQIDEIASDLDEERKEVSQQVAITEYVGDHPRVYARIKKRYSDFQVHEIDLNNKLVRLTDLTPPAQNDLTNSESYFTHCTLYKEGHSWADFVQFICRKLRIKPRQLSPAGMKDMVAKTSQRISVANVDAEKLAELSTYSSFIKLGNFSYSKHPLHMGALKGNHFRLLLRYMKKGDAHNFRSSPSSSSVSDDFERAAKSLKELGFVNYFGLQRFALDSNLIGQAMLQHNWLRVFDLLLEPRENNDPDWLRECKIRWVSDRDFTHFEACRPVSLGKLHNRQDVRLLCGLAEFYKGGGANHKSLRKAFNVLPKPSRIFFINAFRSFLWNKICTYRLQKYGLKPVVGDMVRLVDDDSSNIDDDIGHYYFKEPDHGRGSSLGVPPGKVLSTKVKVLTEADLSQPDCPYTIHDVVLPFPGICAYSDSYHPMPDVDTYYKQILNDNGLDQGSFRKFHNIKMSQLETRTTYRSLIVRPGHIQTKIVPCRSDAPCDAMDNIIPSDWDLLKNCLEGEGISSQMASLSSSLLTSPDGTKGYDVHKLDKDGQEFDEMAAVLEFSLPVCSYATMALREVLLD